MKIANRTNHYLLCLLSCSALFIGSNSWAMGAKPQAAPTEVDALCGQQVQTQVEMPGSEKIFEISGKDLIPIIDPKPLYDSYWHDDDRGGGDQIADINFIFPNHERPEEYGSPIEQKKYIFEKLIAPRITSAYESSYINALQANWENTIHCKVISDGGLNPDDLYITGSREITYKDEKNHERKGYNISAAFRVWFKNNEENRTQVKVSCARFVPNDPTSMQKDFCQKSLSCALSTADSATRIAIENERAKFSCGASVGASDPQQSSVLQSAQAKTSMPMNSGAADNAGSSAVGAQ